MYRQSFPFLTAPDLFSAFLGAVSSGNGKACSPLTAASNYEKGKDMDAAVSS